MRLVRVTRQIFHQGVFEQIVRGPLFDDLQRRAANVVRVAQGNIDRQFPPRGDFPFPARRTGDLQRSVHQEAVVTGDSVGVLVVADAIHRGWVYPVTLRERGWRFITEQQLEAAIKEP